MVANRKPKEFLAKIAKAQRGAKKTGKVVQCEGSLTGRCGLRAGLVVGGRSDWRQKAGG
jgi:hypothetical protein